MKTTFHKRLAIALAADDRDQQEIARKVNVQPGQLSRWKGSVSPSPDVIAKLIDVLGINGHWLMTGEGTMRQSANLDDSRRLDIIRRVANHAIPDELLELCEEVEGDVSSRRDLLAGIRIITEGFKAREGNGG